jgi:hypothetical protein
MSPIRSFIARTAVASALAGAAFVGTAVPANAAPANYWGAIAISVRTGNIGYALDHPTAGNAVSAAVRKCGARDCQEIVRVANGCAAVAQAPNRAWGWGYGASRASAERAAISGTPGRGARVLQWICTTGHL